MRACMWSHENLSGSPNPDSLGLPRGRNLGLKVMTLSVSYTCIYWSIPADIPSHMPTDWKCMSGRRWNRKFHPINKGFPLLRHFGIVSRASQTNCGHVISLTNQRPIRRTKKQYSDASSEDSWSANCLPPHALLLSTQWESLRGLGCKIYLLASSTRTSLELSVLVSSDPRSHRFY